MRDSRIVYPASAMKTQDQPKDDDLRDGGAITLTLPLDGETLAWLCGMAGGCDREAGRLIASMLKEIRVDDELAHATLH